VYGERRRRPGEFLAAHRSMGKWVMETMASGGYAGLVLLMFAENVFPPIPSEVIVPLAGYLVARGEMMFAAVVIAGTLGSVLGALLLYALGRQLGERRLKQFADRYGRWLTVSRHDLDRARRWFDRHGMTAVFLCRLVPGLRSLISIPAGIARMSFPLFLACTLVGSALWTAALAWLGYLLGSNFGKVESYLDPATWVVFAAIGLAYIVRVIRGAGVPRSR
jgi:membrane protein DedA with SNARE-associated domain